MVFCGAGANNSSVIGFGGTEQYDGSSWTQHIILISETWNGSNWTRSGGNNLNQGKQINNVIWYLNCSNICWWLSGDKTGNSETWNGTNWTEEII